MITVALENAFMPFNGIDSAAGAAIGWDYDALREICARLNCAPVFVETPWAGMLEAVSNGDFDMAADGITITPGRAEIVDYSAAYMAVVERLALRQDDQRFADLASFIAGDGSIGAQAGTTNFAAAVELVGEARVQGFAEFGEAMDALIAGGVDAALVDEYAGQGYSGVHAAEVRLLPDQLSIGELGFVFPPGSDLIAPINRALESMRDDGALAAINARWFRPSQE